MKPFISALILFALFFSPNHSPAQLPSSKSLLWRITGNGLQKPSYLYGTMHLKDKRLFFFTDSVYNGIETSQGFAMELDPDEMMDSLLTKLGHADTTTLVRKMLDEKKFKSVAKKLEKKFGMPADKISRRQLLAERQNWYSRIHKKDDMQSIVDLYLYNIAHKQGKVVGGIEDVNDQMGIIDELGKDVNINELVEDSNDSKRTDYLEKMVTLYTDQDINKIDELFSGGEFKKTKDLLLLHRNVKMAKRMDSLVHIRNSFFAVGVAHLPGEGGVIQLLQNKGFTVEPVFSSKKIAPEKYQYTSVEIPWVKFAGDDSAYTIEMPGKPSDFKAPGAELNFKVYADLVTNIVYMSAFTFQGTNETPGASIDRMSKSFFAKGFKSTGKKKIIKDSIEGIELMATRENIFYRFQFFPITGKLFMLIEGAGKSEDVHSKNVERFLAGFTMNTNVTAKPTTWVNYKNELKAFEISFPKKPGVNNLPVTETGDKIEASTYTLMDIPTNTYYMVVVNDTKKGFVMNEDSVIFKAKLDYYKNNKSEVSDVRNFEYNGNGAMSFSAQTTTEGINYISKILIVCRGNRNYMVAAITEKGREDFLDITNFFKSFILSPFKEATWTNTAGHGGVFSTWAPSAFEYQEPDTMGLRDYEIEEKLMAAKKDMPFVAHDLYSSTSYNVDVYPLSKYYWAKNDSTFIASQLAIYYSDTSGFYARKNPGHFDSLIYVKAVMNGSIKGFEILVKNAGESYYKRVRILPHGGSAYHIYLLAPIAFIKNENNNKYFEDFRFEKENLSSTYLENKAALILNDLQSKDSATKEAATAALQKATFDSASLQLLYIAYLKKYEKDSTEYETINEKIATAINAVKDSSTISFVKENYISGTVNVPELKAGMLNMLAKQQTLPAITLLKQLLLQSPPVTGKINSIIYQLSDSMLLCKTIFPEATRFFGDSLLGAGTIQLVAKLIDSNLLQKDILQQNQEGIFHTAAIQLASAKKDSYSYMNKYVIDVLGMINNKQSIDLLNKFVKVKMLEVKDNALIALLKIKQPVLPVDIHKIAADDGYRISFYKELLKLGKQELFPAEFLTQQLFAESYLYINASDDDDDEDAAAYKFVEERVASIKGIQKRYFLFKTTSVNDGETTSHLAVCGPFDMNRKSILLKDDEKSIKVFYDEKYNLANTNKLYKEFINDEQKVIPLPANK